MSLALFIPIIAIIEFLIFRVVSIIVTAVRKLSAKSKLRVVPERAWRVIFAFAGRPISPEWQILDCVSCATIFHPSRIVHAWVLSVFLFYFLPVSGSNSFSLHLFLIEMERYQVRRNEHYFSINITIFAVKICDTAKMRFGESTS